MEHVYFLNFVGKLNVFSKPDTCTRKPNSNRRKWRSCNDRSKKQENKCAVDTDCQNENKIDNSLDKTIVIQKTIENSTTKDEPKITPTCETCFTDNLTPKQAESFAQSIEIDCSYIIASIAAEEPTYTELLEAASNMIFNVESDVGIPLSTLESIADCLDELYGITLSRP